MTNAEAIQAIKEHCYFANLKDETREALDKAIIALSAETVSKEVYDSEYFRRKDVEFKLHELTHKEPCEDAISREEALMALTGINLPTDKYKLIALFDKRIKALPTVEAVPLSVIEKITTEIEERSTYEGIYLDRADVFEIIDKAVKEYTHEKG